MKKEILINADKWFQLHDITSFIHPKKDTIYIDIGNFELELSKDEIKYRASEYLRLKENNLRRSRKGLSKILSTRNGT